MEHGSRARRYRQGRDRARVTAFASTSTAARHRHRASWRGGRPHPRRAREAHGQAGQLNILRSRTPRSRLSWSPRASPSSYEPRLFRRAMRKGIQSASAPVPRASACRSPAASVARRCRTEFYREGRALQGPREHRLRASRSHDLRAHRRQGVVYKGDMTEKEFAREQATQAPRPARGPRRPSRRRRPWPPGAPRRDRRTP
jgi:small subunit ribosomal protein S3